MMDHEEGENPFAEVELEGGTMGDNGDFAEDDSLLENNNNKANETGVQKPAGMCSCFSIAFYQPYFNVDTDDVKQRLVRSLKGFKDHGVRARVRVRVRVGVRLVSFLRKAAGS